MESGKSSNYQGWPINSAPYREKWKIQNRNSREESLHKKHNNTQTMTIISLIAVAAVVERHLEKSLQ